MARNNVQLSAVFEPEQSDCKNNNNNGNNAGPLNLKIRTKYKFLKKHQEFIQTILATDTNMVIADGYAGTAKTYLAVYGALTLLADKKINSIIYIRSVVESATQKIGHLPGELDQKFYPYSLPLMDKLDELVTKHTADKLLKDEYIRCIPVNFTRGLTFHDSVVIIDEAQNLTKQELTTLLTRFGENSKYIIVGDTHQSDINGKSGFKPIYNGFSTTASASQGIYTFTFDVSEIVRSQILKYIVQVLEKV